MGLLGIPTRQFSLVVIPICWVVVFLRFFWILPTIHEITKQIHQENT